MRPREGLCAARGVGWTSPSNLSWGQSPHPQERLAHRKPGRTALPSAAGLHPKRKSKEGEPA